MVNIENWIPKYIFGYLLFFTFIVFIIGNTTQINASNVYDLTEEQQEIISSPSTDILSFFNKAIILGAINSGILTIEIITALLGVVFVLALLKALKEVIPALPS